MDRRYDHGATAAAHDAARVDRRPSLTAQAGFTVMCVKGQTGELLDVLRWSEATIEWADGDPAKGALLVGSPLAAALGYRATARWWFGRRGWREVLDDAFAIARNADAMTLAFVYSWNTVRILNGVLRADDAAWKTSKRRCGSARRPATTTPSRWSKLRWVRCFCSGTLRQSATAGWSCWRWGMTCAHTYGFPYRNSR